MDKKLLKTKDDLIRANNALGMELDMLRTENHRIRKEFSKIFCSDVRYSSIMPPGTYSLSWEEIFFKIGELNSDADYSVLLEEKCRLDRELGELKLDANNGGD